MVVPIPECLASDSAIATVDYEGRARCINLVNQIIAVILAQFEIEHDDIRLEGLKRFAGFLKVAGRIDIYAMTDK